ncbi:transcriptional regulator, GntR family with aminotransferase domain containing protein [Rhizobium sp. CF080]|uniref:MocR-like pyridoxine biosynthesis transcription factor PdxR n=1 Tax=Rhizobium sp. (strain CF080) TaxID=1144310 RepID=UPI00027188E8|nr:PLP-dependent aminotransferase family protein [Rhizobium sp. CF080]EUB98116.1 transcriptional regulator, GntR family with aminotransferase domain containing protein [Rhizobium sp. CF080]
MAKRISSYMPRPDTSADTAYYRQIYDRFRSAIAERVLKPGERIQSARALAKELGLARGTVETAYALLAAEGYIEARGQAGSVVSPGLKPEAAEVVPVRVVATDPLATSYRPDSILPFQMGLPALDAFPRKVWARLGARRARSMQPSDMMHPDVGGLPELRTQIAAYLRVSRGIDCAPGQVFVTSGYRQTIGLISQTLLKIGDKVWLENPGYPPSRAVFSQMGVDPVAVPVDRDGIVVSEGLRKAPDARAALVTPAHQSPLGVSLSLPRRHGLLDWAARNGAWIIEDDYDGEYRYVSRPLPALKSLDRDGRVLYAGTFSKMLFPSLRLAYLVVPESEVEKFARVVEILAGGSPALTQAIVGDFISEGHFARHIQRMRKLYAERREATVSGLKAALGDQVLIDQQPGGMHLILRLERRDDRHVVERMRKAGLYAEALSDWTFEGKETSALLVNFTNVASFSLAEGLGHRIAGLL